MAHFTLKNGDQQFGACFMNEILQNKYFIDKQANTNVRFDIYVHFFLKKKMYFLLIVACINEYNNPI